MLKESQVGQTMLNNIALTFILLRAKFRPMLRPAKDISINRTMLVFIYNDATIFIS